MIACQAIPASTNCSLSVISLILKLFNNTSPLPSPAFPSLLGHYCQHTNMLCVPTLNQHVLGTPSPSTCYSVAHLLFRELLTKRQLCSLPPVFASIPPKTSLVGPCSPPWRVPWARSVAKASGHSTALSDLHRGSLSPLRHPPRRPPGLPCHLLLSPHCLVRPRFPDHRQLKS